VPYANAHFDRPEISQKFEKKGLKPSEDFAEALFKELKSSNLFRDVHLIQQNNFKNADLIVTGRIIKASIDTKITRYGMSILGLAPWVTGLNNDSEFITICVYENKS
jgi:hypothetical protein